MHALTLLPVLFGLGAFADLINVQFPHLIIPLVNTAPNISFGTRLDATISYSPSSGAAEYTEISFDVPNNNAAICRLNFYINTDANKNAPRQLSGDAPYLFNITRLDPKINKDSDNWNSYPATTGHVKTVELDHAGVKGQDDGWFTCPKGQVAQFLLRPASNRAFRFYWFELDYPANEGGAHGVVLEMHT
ncbi:Nn.00g113250.m01.CDS01 [Neocucurbitaria sp. VM-36]